MRTVMKVRRRLGAAPPPPPPPPLVPFQSDAIAWLDAFQLIDDGLVDGDPVTNWTATINPVNGSAVQTGVGVIPSLSDDVDGSGKPGVVFNGSNDFMFLGDAWKLLSTQGYSIYIAVRRNAAVNRAFFAWRDDPTNNSIAGQFAGSGRANGVVGGTVSSAGPTNLFLSGDRRIFSMVNFSAAGFDVFVNADASGGAATNATGVATLSGPILGGRLAGPGYTTLDQAMPCTVQCMLVYSTEHDAAAQTTVLNFLYNRYGVVP
jgi:hypothetical protein